MKCDLGIVFLGICERASYVTDKNTNIPKCNILGLKHITLSYIYPLPLSDIILVMAFDQNITKSSSKISITNHEKQEVGFLTIDFQTVNPTTEEVVLKKDGPVLPVLEKGWMTVFLPIGKSNIVIPKPGIYYLNVETDGQKEIIGEIQFAVIDPSPLTPERIAAIKSDPTSLKSIRIELGCKKCPDKFKAYTDLEPPNQKLEEDGHCLYTDIPDQFSCGCGNTNIDLQIIRNNLHGYLGQRKREGEGLDVAFTPLYEKSTLEDIKNRLIRLINSNPKEEILQQFIQENLILLHQFPAEEIFFKPQILTSYKADFGIISPQKELILIEIEKTTTKLLKKNGGTHSELNHAFDQVRDWLHIVDEHKLAFLAALGIDHNQVSAVRGVVIAGRDSGCDAKHLRKLRGSDLGRITFLTYDDLLFALDALIREIENL